jgi:hypothetical protein
MMTNHPIQAPDRVSSTSNWNGIDWTCAIGLGVALTLAVSQQSLWIDEASTASIAMQPSLGDWWSQMKHVRGSDLQMPLYMIYVWGLAKAFGPSEWALRASGLFGLLAGLMAMAGSMKDRRERIAFFVVAGTSAFIWYYASEARPYAMQLGAACAIFAAVRRLSSPMLDASLERKWLAVFLTALVCLCGSSLLGVIWAAPGLAALLLLAPASRLARCLRRGWGWLGLTAIALAVLAVYYRWTLSLGARASAAGRTNWQTAAFIFYEQLGFTGMGPGRTQLRDAGPRSLVPYAPILAAYGMAMAAILWRGFKRIWRPSIWPLAMLCVATGLFLIAAGVVMHFRVLGRHFTPLLPLILIFMASGLLDWWLRPGWIGRSVAVGFVALSLYSALSIRFAPRHARDDYRSAGAAANNALQQGKSVWWNAAEEGATYYRVKFALAAGQSGATLVVNPSAALLDSLPKPSVVIASKPDLYDTTGALKDYLQRNHYHNTAAYLEFTVWEE